MREKLRWLVQEIKIVLVSINAGDIMGLYATIWGVVFVGAGILMYQTNHLIGIIFLFLSPVPIFIFTVITKLLIGKFAKMLPSPAIETANVSEIIFPNLSVSKKLSIEKATPEQVMAYIKNSISSTLWTTLVYDVDRKKTSFYYPEKDNTLVQVTFP